MEALELLQQRNSNGRLIEPAPSRADLDSMFAAAMRAPDHGRLQPWRFIVIEGDARAQLGALYAAALQQRKADASPDEIKKNLDAPLRAPLLVTVVARLRDHPKVPRVEQLLAAGCAAQGILLAAQALGYGAMWRTGDNSYDPTVKAGLGLSDDEEIVGYLYLGTPSGAAKPLPPVNLRDFVSYWP